MTTEPPRPDQIQANVAAALSRLRGELAPTPPAGAPPAGAQLAGTPGSSFNAAQKPEEQAADPILTAAEPLIDVAPTLRAPDPSMALNQGQTGSDMLDTPFARLTGVKPTEQPDLLAGIGTTPPPLADLPDAEFEAAHRKRRLRNRLLAGAVLVIALAGFWILSGGGDAGNEPVPVITAESTPEKVKPVDEGGLEVPNQDVAILNGENAEASTQGETVLPLPEQPATPPAVPEPAPAPATTAAPSVDTAASDSGAAIPAIPAPAVDAIPSVPAPEATAEPAPAVTAETQPAAAAPAPVAETAPAADAAPAVEAAPVQTASAQPAAVGSARIQLAAVKTEAAAQKEWARLQKAHPELLNALTLHVETFNKSASEVFYRVQAGPLQDKASAKRLCAELKQKNQACIVAN